MNNNISFTSYLKPVSMGTFYSATMNLPKRCKVDYPWTAKESALASSVVTDKVVDCSVCVISDGKKALMLHINPNCDDAKYFGRVEKYIGENLDLTDENLEAFVIGAKPPCLMGEASYSLFDKFVNFLDKFGIPTTILKGGKGERAIAYSSLNDTLYVACDKPFFNDYSSRRLPIDILTNWFDDVKIHSKDRVII